MRCDLKKRILLVGVFLAVSCPAVFAQQRSGSASATSAKSNVPRATGATVAGNAAVLSPAQLIDFLTQTIDWYHKVTIQQETVTEPEEQLTLYDNRQIAKQVVQLAFEFARTQADAIEQSAPKKTVSAAGGLPQSQTLAQMQAKLDKDYQDTQTEMEGDQKQLATAVGANRKKLEATISELQGEIALIQARRDAVQSMADFVSSSAA